ncbi:MAG TPA: FCSD flavin-binding domain-containing protein [Paucimonas sp.]|nr:FCSD flavin-binding domain-containing protein [Paucimonas sp.]
MQRRRFIQALGAGAALSTLGACAAAGSKAGQKIVVVGGGYGGATAAKYIRLWSSGAIDVTLVEPNAEFVSCPLSNLVLGGSRQLADLTVGYEQLTRRRGVDVVRDRAQAIDADKRIVRLAGGATLPYDRLILSPGVDFLWDMLPGMKSGQAQRKVLHAWKAGAQTLALRKQLEAMPDGGTYVISIPLAPYRCPPGPYERACQVAHYFSQAKKKSKVLILDANEDVTSKAGLFKKVWAERYKGIVEYQPKFVAVDVDAASNTVISDFGDKVQAAVLNVVPPQRAGDIAARSGLANMNKRWCEVDYLTFESTQAQGIHVIGDAIQIAPLMPKSGHMANQHGKVCAAAVIDLLAGRAPDPNPMITNTCYSFVSDKDVIHVASVHAYNAEKKTYLTVPGSGGVSPAPSALEGEYGMFWARNIWADTFG